MADWFRWWHGSVTDPKFMWVARRSGRSLAEVIAIWAALLETASNAETRGNVSCFDSVSYDCLMSFEDGICDRIVAAMTDKGMIDADGNLTGWNRRQPKREDQPSAESRAKSSTERVRAYRERMKAQHCEADETKTKRSETQETVREEESREEVNPPSSFAIAQEEDPPAAAKQKAKTQTFRSWLNEIRGSGEKAISAYGPVWEYADRVGIPREWIELAWLCFRKRYERDEKAARKRYADWRRVFLNAIEGNWLNLWCWSERDRTYRLTTVGVQADAEMTEDA